MKQTRFNFRHGIALAALATAGLAAVGPTHAQARPKTPPPISAEIDLRLHESKALSPDGPRVKFLGFEDHRCPSDVACATAGYAYVVLAVQDKDEEPRLVVPSPVSIVYRDLEKRQQHPKYSFHLESLEPRPLMNGKVDPQSYVVRIRIESAERKR